LKASQALSKLGLLHEAEGGFVVARARLRAHPWMGTAPARVRGTFGGGARGGLHPGSGGSCLSDAIAGWWASCVGRRVADEDRPSLLRQTSAHPRRSRPPHPRMAPATVPSPTTKAALRLMQESSSTKPATPSNKLLASSPADLAERIRMYNQRLHPAGLPPRDPLPLRRGALRLRHLPAQRRQLRRRAHPVEKNPLRTTPARTTPSTASPSSPA